jgi:hypothetical protein
MRLVGTIAEDLALLQYAERLGELGGRRSGRLGRLKTGAWVDPERGARGTPKA